MGDAVSLLPCMWEKTKLEDMEVKMFGLKLMTRKTWEKELKREKKNGEREGLWNIVELLKRKDKIYLDEVRLKGDGHRIEHCVFFSKPNKSSIRIEQ